VQTSRDRILTTHTGALYRPRALEEMLKAKVNGQPYDSAALEDRLRTAVADVVQQQAAHGVDMVSDGDHRRRGHRVPAALALAARGGGRLHAGKRRSHFAVQVPALG